MRIEAYSQIQNLYKGSTAKTVKPESSKSFMDNLQLSNLAKESKMAKQAVSEAPDIRKDLVADIKERIKDGTYNVDTKDFAEKLFQRYSVV